MTLQVGQKLWCVPMYSRGRPHEITIESIGRKWGKIGEGDSKIDLDTLVVHDREMGGIAQCHLDRGTYESEMRLRKTWGNFKLRLPHFPPAGATTEEIIALAAKWGMPLETKGTT